MAVRPLVQPPPHQGLSSLADVSTPYDPPPIAGQDRDEAWAKYLMRRVLHFASGLASA